MFQLNVAPGTEYGSEIKHGFSIIKQPKKLMWIIKNTPRKVYANYGSIFWRGKRKLVESFV